MLELQHMLSGKNYINNKKFLSLTRYEKEPLIPCMIETRMLPAGTEILPESAWSFQESRAAAVFDQVLPDDERILGLSAHVESGDERRLIFKAIMLVQTRMHAQKEDSEKAMEPYDKVLEAAEDVKIRFPRLAIYSEFRTEYMEQSDPSIHNNARVLRELPKEDPQEVYLRTMEGIKRPKAPKHPKLEGYELIVRGRLIAKRVKRAISKTLSKLPASDK